ncbi:hypothetical protein DYU05_15290 [Mucilaginibacter terrenus]|uniref:Uncharacterized protein n=1 Tax=Mucilaginibacter terrenus TaxID=2482727 RepID=A0A3E2NRI2_9SPHI|nr:hypothetical protein DYU05_15290 [Mucilaginibacter terrenus]
MKQFVVDNTNNGESRLLIYNFTLWQRTTKPKEASNIFHCVIKASVSKKATEKKDKKVKPKTKK